MWTTYGILVLMGILTILLWTSYGTKKKKVDKKRKKKKKKQKKESTKNRRERRLITRGTTFSSLYPPQVNRHILASHNRLENGGGPRMRGAAGVGVGGAESRSRVIPAMWRIDEVIRTGASFRLTTIQKARVGQWLGVTDDGRPAFGSRFALKRATPDAQREEEKKRARYGLWRAVTNANSTNFAVVSLVVPTHAIGFAPDSSSRVRVLVPVNSSEWSTELEALYGDTDYTWNEPRDRAVVVPNSKTVPLQDPNRETGSTALLLGGGRFLVSIDQASDGEVGGLALLGQTSGSDRNVGTDGAYTRWIFLPESERV